MMYDYPPVNVAMECIFNPDPFSSQLYYESVVGIFSCNMYESSDVFAFFL